MLVCVHSLGLGAVWCGSLPGSDRERRLTEIASLPEGKIPIGLIVIGHPAQMKAIPRSRFEQAKVHYEKW
jgi:nitroreductase